MILSGKTAAERLLGYKRWQTAMCLNAVWNAFGSPKSDGKSPYTLARHGWENTPAERRHSDRRPPLGAVVYFINIKNPSAPGHIAIALGDGELIASTDKPGIGQTGRSSIGEIERSWGGRRYLGWSDYFLGHDILTGTGVPAPAPIPLTPENIGDTDMIRIQSPGRGIALIGPGYYRHLTTDEEVQQSAPIITKHVSGNDRQFDLWVSMALAGRGAATGEKAPVDTGAIVEQVLTGIRATGVTVEVDVDAVARAVNDNLAARIAG